MLAYTTQPDGHGLQRGKHPCFRRRLPRSVHCQSGTGHGAHLGDAPPARQEADVLRERAQLLGRPVDGACCRAAVLAAVEGDAGPCRDRVDHPVERRHCKCDCIAKQGRSGTRGTHPKGGKARCQRCKVCARREVGRTRSRAHCSRRSRLPRMRRARRTGRRSPTGTGLQQRPWSNTSRVTTAGCDKADCVPRGSACMAVLAGHDSLGLPRYL